MFYCRQYLFTCEFYSIYNKFDVGVSSVQIYYI